MNRFFSAIHEVFQGKPLSLRSSKWETVRKAWLAQNNSCKACGSTEKLQVHHKQPFHIKPELELDPTNFITLCEDPKANECHLKIGHMGNWKSFNPLVETDAYRALQLIKIKNQLAFGHPNIG